MKSFSRIRGDKFEEEKVFDGNIFVLVGAFQKDFCDVYEITLEITHQRF